jgi:hypothetical protein
MLANLVLLLTPGWQTAKLNYKSIRLTSDEMIGADPVLTAVWVHVWTVKKVSSVFCQFLSLISLVFHDCVLSVKNLLSFLSCCTEIDCGDESTCCHSAVVVERIDAVVFQHGRQEASYDTWQPSISAWYNSMSIVHSNMFYLSCFSKQKLKWKHYWHCWNRFS